MEVQLPPSLQAAAPLAVTRAEYERVTAELFERALVPVLQARRALRRCTSAAPPLHLRCTSATRAPHPRRTHAAAVVAAAAAAAAAEGRRQWW